MIDGKIIHRKLNKMPYTGSYQGMRFYLTAKEDQIEAYVYPEPFCMEKTPDDQKIHRKFPFNEEGFEQVTDWLNQMFEEKKEFWREARKNKFLI